MLWTAPRSLPTPPFPLAAVDTETCRFEDPKHDINRKTRHEAFKYPQLVLGSIAVDNHLEVLRSDDFLRRLVELLNAGYHFAMHNCTFDYGVIERACRESQGLGGVGDALSLLLRESVDQNRVHDTKLLEQLLNIARGSQALNAKVLKAETLADLAKRRAGITLNKDESVRLGFDAYLDPAYPIPPEFLEYAASDAEATFRVFCSQYKEAQLYATPDEHCKFPILPGATDRFGLLTETLQVKGALGLAWLEQYPLRVDLAEVEAVRARLSAESDTLRAALVEFGFARLTPKKRDFKLSFKDLRRLLSTYASERRIVPPYSSSGLLSLTYDFWAQVLPRLEPRLLARPADARGITESAAVWLRYMRVHKLLSTYIQPYSTNTEHYPTYYPLGARTGRVSCVRPNATNIPKHKDGIRGLFSGRITTCLRTVSSDGSFGDQEVVGNGLVLDTPTDTASFTRAANAFMPIAGPMSTRLLRSPEAGSSCIPVIIPPAAIQPISAAGRRPRTSPTCSPREGAGPSPDEITLTGKAADLWSQITTARSTLSTDDVIGLRLTETSGGVVAWRNRWCLVEADFKAAELVALAQVYKLLYGGSHLGDAINEGLDPHIETAKRLVGADKWEILPPEERKKYRQMAKAVGFGLPGGLGAAKFQLYCNKSYGLNLTESEARELRHAALAADPELAAYLSDGASISSRLELAARNLSTTFNELVSGLRAWRLEEESEPHWRLAWSRLRKWSYGDDRFELPEPPGFNRRFDLFRSTSASPAGFIRGRCSFTEAHNLPFQSLVACGAKLAMWNLYQAHVADPFWQPSAFIHDSALVTCPRDRVADMERILVDCMKRGLSAVCPDIRVEVETTGALERWGKSTSPLGAPVTS